ncbi:MAG: hypothetical protein AAGK17_03505 [Pseudomonadota bacterium]
MTSRSKSWLAAIALVWLAGCSNSSGHDHHHETGIDDASGSLGELSCATGEPPPPLGLVSSLPLYWPLDADISDLASGAAQLPWQRQVLSACFTLLALNTLSPEPTAPGGPPPVGALDGLDQLLIVQPRVLTPLDNVALDDWVRQGGEALILLDPLLTGHYDLPLGDPRRPVDTSLVAIPPVVTRWGLQVEFDEPESLEAGTIKTAFGDAELTVEVGSRWKIVDPNAASCDSFADGFGVQCKIGEGRVTLFGDAALFEHREIAGEDFEAIAALLDFAFAD